MPFSLIHAAITCVRTLFNPMSLPQLKSRQRHDGKPLGDNVAAPIQPNPKGVDNADDRSRL